MRSRLVILGALTIAALGAVVACSSAESAFGSEPNPTNDSGSPGEGGFTPGVDAGATPPFVNGLFLVHAASFPAFRVCFDGALESAPMPSTDVMPAANVVGVDVGSVVRLDPIAASLGHAYVFEESKIRMYYATPEAGPTCNQLIYGPTPPPYLDVGEIKASVTTGVHILALTGCLKATDDPAATKARCGATWSAPSGNLGFTHVELRGDRRVDPDHLPVQVLQLSAPLEGDSAGKALGVSFGVLAAPPPLPFVDDLAVGVPAPSIAAPIAFDAGDTAGYASTGFFVTRGASTDGGVDGGARQVVVSQSLADIQVLSDPKSIPSDWYAAASNYVLLVVGAPAPKLPDGGPDDDPRSALHILSVPLAADTDTNDAGAL